MWVVYTYMLSKNSVVSKDAIFYLPWYNVKRSSSHRCKKSSFFSFYNILVKFTNNTAEVIEQNWQSVTKLNGVQNAIKQVT